MARTPGSPTSVSAVSPRPAENPPEQTTAAGNPAAVGGRGGGGLQHRDARRADGERPGIRRAAARDRDAVDAIRQGIAGDEDDRMATEAEDVAGKALLPPVRIRIVRLIELA